MGAAAPSHAARPDLEFKTFDSGSGALGSGEHQPSAQSARASGSAPTGACLGVLLAPPHRELEG